MSLAKHLATTEDRPIVGWIHTCQLCGANSFEYLTELQRHARELAANPAAWMPWNYHQTLEQAEV